MTRDFSIYAAVAFGFALTACNDLDLPPEELVVGDETAYAELVQPYAGLACGSLDCHGDSGRALRLYAQYGLRADAALRDTDISPEEIVSNLYSISAISPGGGPPANHVVLLKALAPEAGGMNHVGDVIWEDTEAPGYQCVLAWLSNNSADQAARDACAAAYADVELPEP